MFFARYSFRSKNCRFLARKSTILGNFWPEISASWQFLARNCQFLVTKLNLPSSKNWRICQEMATVTKNVNFLAKIPEKIIWNENFLNENYWSQEMATTAKNMRFSTRLPRNIDFWWKMPKNGNLIISFLVEIFLTNYVTCIFVQFLEPGSFNFVSKNWRFLARNCQ